jgi:hypothetical protein
VLLQVKTAEKRESQKVGEKCGKLKSNTSPENTLRFPVSLLMACQKTGATSTFPNKAGKGQPGDELFQDHFCFLVQCLLESIRYRVSHEELLLPTYNRLLLVLSARIRCRFPVNPVAVRIFLQTYSFEAFFAGIFLRSDNLSNS